MKKILVPISFSKASQNSLLHAASLFNEAKLSLLYVYPVKKYSRKYDFGNKEYADGIKEKLQEFYHQHIKHTDIKASFLTNAGSISSTINKISSRYDLMVMSRKTHPSRKNGYFSDKKLFIITMTHCPVLIMPETESLFKFENCEHIWHIKQKESETKVVMEGIQRLGANPSKMETKSPHQTNFLSSFWKNILAYEKSHDKNLIKKIDEAHNEEPIDLIVLVDNEKTLFTNLFKSDIIHLFCKYDIPILVFPNLSKK